MYIEGGLSSYFSLKPGHRGAGGTSATPLDVEIATTFVTICPSNSHARLWLIASLFESLGLLVPLSLRDSLRDSLHDSLLLGSYHRLAIMILKEKFHFAVLINDAIASKIGDFSFIEGTIILGYWPTVILGHRPVTFSFYNPTVIVDCNIFITISSTIKDEIFPDSPIFQLLKRVVLLKVFEN